MADVLYAAFVASLGALTSGTLAPTTDLIAVARSGVDYKATPDALMAASISAATSITPKKIAFSSTATFSGTAFTNSQLYSTTTWTGSNSGTDRTPFNTIYAYDAVAAGFGAGGGSNALYIGHNINSSSKTGAVYSLDVVGGITAQTGNVAAGHTTVYYSAARFLMIGAVNDGGTGGTPANGIFGINPSVQLAAGAGYWNSIVGGETNVEIGAGTVALFKIGHQIVLTAADAVSGTTDDVAFSIGNQSVQSSAYGWSNGILFGRNGGYFGIKTTGTMIGAKTQSGSMTVAYGIDWNSVTFSSAVLRSPGVLVTGAGAATFSNMTVQSGSLANYMQIAPAATGLRPGLYAQGSDANVDALVSAQGTSGSVLLAGNNGSTSLFQASSVASANGFVIALAGNSAASPMQFFGSGTGNNILIGGTSLATGVIATNATTGMPMVPRMAGTPSGTVVNNTLGAAVVTDTTASKWWVNVAGTWKGVALAASGSDPYLPSAGGTVTGDVTVNTNVILKYLQRSVATGLTATGTTRADALALSNAVNNVTTAAASTGVVLPSSGVGLGGKVKIYNNGANPIKVYAAGSDTIDGTAGSTGVTLTNGKRCEFEVLAANVWVSAQLGVTSA